MGKIKRLIVAVVVLAVIVVMALRGCPRIRKGADSDHVSSTARPDIVSLQAVSASQDFSGRGFV